MKVEVYSLDISLFDIGQSLLHDVASRHPTGIESVIFVTTTRGDRLSLNEKWISENPDDAILAKAGNILLQRSK